MSDEAGLLMLANPFLVLVVILPYVYGDVCQDNTIVNGCTTPYNMKLFYKETFRPACNLHDICYYCAYSTCGKSKADCDMEFYHNMLNICSNLKLHRILRISECLFAAFAYYEVVDKFAKSHFNTLTTTPSCKEKWVKTCIVKK